MNAETATTSNLNLSKRSPQITHNSRLPVQLLIVVTSSTHTISVYSHRLCTQWWLSSTDTQFLEFGDAPRFLSFATIAE